MEKTVLVVDRDAPVGRELAELARHRGYRLVQASAFLPGGQDVPKGDDQLIPWNKVSPISARDLVLKSRRTLGTIDQALVVHSMSGSPDELGSTSLTQIDAMVDADVKGYLYLLRELIHTFRRQAAGTIACIAHRPEELSSVGCNVFEGFVGLVESLLTSSVSEPFALKGYVSESANLADFAQFIYSGNEEQSPKTRGRWQRYTGRVGIFSALPFSGRR